MRDLNDLQFFVAVVAQRSFSGAARLLGVPKSRVSRRVSLFEERLGVRLLERSTRRLSVTEIGQIIFEHARIAGRGRSHRGDGHFGRALNPVVWCG